MLDFLDEVGGLVRLGPMGSGGVAFPPVGDV